ncbi:MAG: hypothetical protein [Caudoviricetes sp.]|nr:MAG: hypothetical protein [Caudoviricetes sp.]
MGLYAIHAFENVYGGLHGMESYAVVECKDEFEVSKIAEEMSFSIINSYDFLMQEIEREALESYESQGYSIENSPYEDDIFVVLLEMAIKNRIEYEIYLVKETDKSLNKLNHIIKLRPKYFIEKYCCKIK